MITMHVTYTDGKTLDVNVPPEDFSSFFQDLNQGRVHWDSLNYMGFWTSFANVRFIQFINDANAPASPVAPVASSPEIPDSSKPLLEATN